MLCRQGEDPCIVSLNNVYTWCFRCVFISNMDREFPLLKFVDVVHSCPLNYFTSY